MRWIFVTLAAVAAAACQISVPPGTAGGADGARVPAGGAVLTTERDSYTVGQPIRLTLHNRTAGPLGVNVCISALERRQGQQWTEVPEATDEICPAVLRMLEPGGTDSHEFRLRGDLPAGEYRFRTRVERMDGGADERVASEPFQLRR